MNIHCLIIDAPMSEARGLLPKNVLSKAHGAPYSKGSLCGYLLSALPSQKERHARHMHHFQGVF